MDQQPVRPAVGLISGDIGSGKTTLCRQLAALARQEGLDCAGVISPGRYREGRKVGIDLLDLRSGERRPLAEMDHQPAELRTPAFRFHPDALAWGAAVIDAAAPCDLLLVDELGPLELVRSQGWANALTVLRGGAFRLAVVVVRPSLVEAFRAALPASPIGIWTLPTDRPEALPAELLRSLQHWE